MTMTDNQGTTKTITINSQLQASAKLIYAPYGYQSCFTALDAVRKGEEKRFKEDELVLLNKANDNLWGITAANAHADNMYLPATVPMTDTNRITVNQKMAEVSITREAVTMTVALERAKEIYREVGFTDLQSAYFEAETGVFTKEQRRDILDGWYAIGDKVNISNIHNSENKELYIDFARQQANKMGYGKIKVMIEDIIAIEPLFSAKELVQMKIGWQLIEEQRKEKKARNRRNPFMEVDRTRIPARQRMHYDGINTPNVHYPVRNITGGNITGTNWSGGWSPYYADDDEEYPYRYHRRASFMPAKDAQLWRETMGLYVATRVAGEETVFIGEQDIPSPEDIVSVAIVQGETAVMQQTVRDNQIEAADDAVADAAGGLAITKESIVEISRLMGFVPQGGVFDALALTQFEIDEAIGRMTKHSTVESVVTAAETILYSLIECNKLQAHIEKLEALITQEAAKQKESAIDAAFQKDIEERDQWSNYNPEGETVAEFLARVGKDAHITNPEMVRSVMNEIERAAIENGERPEDYY